MERNVPLVERLRTTLEKSLNKTPFCVWPSPNIRKNEHKINMQILLTEMDHDTDGSSLCQAQGEENEELKFIFTIIIIIES